MVEANIHPYITKPSQTEADKAYARLCEDTNMMLASSDSFRRDEGGGITCYLQGQDRQEKGFVISASGEVTEL